MVDEFLTDLDEPVPGHGSLADVWVTTATIHPVVVDGHDELLVVVDRLALPAQPQHALAYRLGDVDGVLHTGDGVVVVVPDSLAVDGGLGVTTLGGRGRVDLLPGFGLHEVAGRVLQVVTQLGTGDLHGGEGVVEDVQSGDVLDLHLTLGEQGGTREWRHLGDHRGVCVLGLLEGAGDGVCLHGSDEVQDGGVLDHGPLRRHLLGRCCDDRVHVPDGLLVGSPQVRVIGELGVLGNVTGVALGGPGGDRAVVDANLLTREAQRDLHIGDGTCPVVGLRDEHLVPRGAVHDGRDVVAVGVSGDDEVDALGLGGHRGGHVLVKSLVDRGGVLLVQATMDQGDDDISSLPAQLTGVLVGGGDRVGEVDAALEHGPVPHGRAGRGDAHDANLDVVAANLLGHHGRGLAQGLTRLDVDDVGPQQWGVEALGEGVLDVHAVVELVVASVGGVVADEVEGSGHRVGGVTQPFRLLGSQVRQWRSLDGVPVVDGDDRVGAAVLTRLFDDRGGTGESERG